MDLESIGRAITMIVMELKDALWFYLEPPLYYGVDYIVNVINNFLLYIVNNFLFSILLIVSLPFAYKFFKGIILTAYKMSCN